ncbi:unnamed protein product [Nyctereutes procyonoides]|uniref:(raccoon dog) hypothetical protein n=1 Tax=Nyctereutes procyonoides TaxID=34880 RepID=A0A811YPA2_NYCPR|nr:unnamed protein product [Nyctereutes procyonoides]
MEEEKQWERQGQRDQFKDGGATRTTAQGAALPRKRRGAGEQPRAPGPPGPRRPPPPPAAPLGGPPVTRRAARARRPPTLRESAAPDGSTHAGRRPRAAFPPSRLPAAAARRLRAPSRLSPRRARAGPGEAGAGGDGAAIVPQPLPGAQEALAAGRGGRGLPSRCAPAPPARPRGPPPPAARARLCGRAQPLGAGAPPPPPPPLRPGLQMAPDRLCASRRLPGPGTSGGAAPGPHPAAAARRRPPPAARLAARPDSPDAPPALRPRRAQPLTAGRGAPAGRARGLGEDSWPSAGEIPTFEAAPLRPKTSSPNVRETKGIC